MKLFNVPTGYVTPTHTIFLMHKTNHTLLPRQLPLSNQLHPLKHLLQPTLQNMQWVVPQLPLFDQSRRQPPEMFSEFPQLLVGLPSIRRRPRRPLSEDRRTQYPVCLYCDSRGSAWDYRVERDVYSACAADGGETAGCGVVGGDAVEGVAEVVGGVGFLVWECQ
jgi:hypothetical protein